MDVRKVKPLLEYTIKQIDPDVIVGGTFYDEASDRFFLTIFDGRRKVEVMVPSRDCENGRMDKVKDTLNRALEKLKRTPIG
jgi:hypothetical protein